MAIEIHKGKRVITKLNKWEFDLMQTSLSLKILHILMDTGESWVKPVANPSDGTERLYDPLNGKSVLTLK